MSEITKEIVEQAITIITRDGVPFRRRSTKHCLLYPGEGGTHLPPKQVLRTAKKLARLPVAGLVGGPMCNQPLRELGYVIVECNCRNSGLRVL